MWFLTPLPFLHRSNLCLVTASKVILCLQPGSFNDPLFQFPNGQLWCPLTDSNVRKHFKVVFCRLALQDAGITFHYFRRSATVAFNSNVSLQNIQRQGTWISECVWRNITDSSDATNDVAISFQNLLSTSSN